MAALMLRSFDIMKPFTRCTSLADNFITNCRLQSATNCLWRLQRSSFGYLSCDRPALSQFLCGRRAWIVPNKRLSLYPSACSAHGVERTTFQKLLRVMGKYEFSRSKLDFAGVVLYTKCTDDVNYVDFINKCDMVDTFLSWFLLTELHVWMCMVRLSGDGEEEKVVRNSLTASLWRDTTHRMKLVATLSASKRKDQLYELYEQFMASLYLYDEGLLTNDKVLAAALWRTLLQSKCENPAILESLVEYVRKQTLHLEQYPRDYLLTIGEIKWLPLSDPNDYHRL